MTEDSDRGTPAGDSGALSGGKRVAYAVGAVLTIPLGVIGYLAPSSVELGFRLATMVLGIGGLGLAYCAVTGRPSALLEGLFSAFRL